MPQTRGVVSGKDDDADVGVGIAGDDRELKSVERAQPDVRHQGVETLLTERAPRALERGMRGDLPSRLTECPLDGIQQLRIVIDDQDMGRLRAVSHVTL